MRIVTVKHAKCKRKLIINETADLLLGLNSIYLICFVFLPALPNFCNIKSKTWFEAKKSFLLMFKIEFGTDILFQKYVQ